jgi:hypothetical protein
MLETSENAVLLGTSVKKEKRQTPLILVGGVCLAGDSPIRE